MTIRVETNPELLFGCKTSLSPEDLSDYKHETLTSITLSLLSVTAQVPTDLYSNSTSVIIGFKLNFKYILVVKNILSFFPQSPVVKVSLTLVLPTLYRLVRIVQTGSIINLISKMLLISGCGRVRWRTFYISCYIENQN